MKVLLSSPNKNVVLSHSFLTFLRSFASLRSSFLQFGKILPHLWEFNHPFLPWGRELDKKLPWWPGFTRSKIFRGLPGEMYPVGIDWDIRPHPD